MEELFSGDRQLLTGIGGEVSAFPEPAAAAEHEAATGGLSYHHHQPLISPPPPQKLRPIRSSAALRNIPAESQGQGQVFASASTSTSTSRARNKNGSRSPELGFLPTHRDFGQILPNGTSHSSPLPLVKIKSEMDANFISTINSQISHLPLSFSSSSDGSTDSAGKVEEPGPSVKPKSKKRKRLESFLQDLMSQVIQKQEEMHQQLMEMIENKERERIMREEAWRRQEMERSQKEQELRSQEAARNLALLSFFQNALGQPQDIQMSQSLPAASGEDDAETDPNNKRWPTSEVQALITLRTALDHKFRTMGPKAPVWEEVSAGMANMGYNRSAKKCKEKWDNVNKYFRKAIGNGKKHSENARSCPYFHELETLYRNQLITTEKAKSPSDEDVQQNGKD